MLWQCEDECKYICMHEINRMKTTIYNLPVEKYYGHWPYIRVWNVQEPAATFFSLLNILPHLYFLIFQLSGLRRKHSTDKQEIEEEESAESKCKQLQEAEARSMVSYLGWFPYISINAWIMSAVYHTRKVEFTTHLDLVSALLLVSYATWCALRMLLSRIVIFSRCRELALPDSASPSAWSVAKVVNDWSVGVAFAIYSAFICQRIVSMVVFNSVSFESHMILCIALSVAHTLLWGVWIVLGFFPSHPEGAEVDTADKTNKTESKSPSSQQTLGRGFQSKYLCILCQVYFSVAALSLEVYDFPPVLQHFDAHACWHAATVPLGFLWYVFWMGEL